ncbi:MAG: GntR family transcriptional regulator [Syntrophorhabdaceae bacterium]|nr:GntR family transcriptional regulator [Syntrophorhabdaceae bacterium]
MGEAAKDVLKIENRILMRDMAYEKIKDAILKGMFKPHARLIEEKIAGLIGTSRTPIREVFQRLEKDGLIYRRPRGGYAVAENNENIQKEQTELLLGLICFAVYLATMKISEENIKTLEEILKNEEKAIQQRDIHSFYLNTLRFYRTVFLCAENRILFNLTKMNSIGNFIANTLKENSLNDLKKRIRHHRKIIFYIKKRNPDMAEKSVRRMWSSNKDRIF